LGERRHRGTGKSVALVSDCGTPGFCDPGADLVDACYEMEFLSISGLRLDRFLFFGFLPARNDLRERAWVEIKKQTIPVILMETRYRSVRLCADLAAHVPRRYCVLAADLTLASQKLTRGQGSDFAKEAFSGKIHQQLVWNFCQPSLRRSIATQSLLQDL
jgi:16S rRNA C1402 (ribose-2'-O) methylase RsmI